MSIKDELKKIKQIFSETIQNEKIDNNKVYLDDKVNDFIDWYYNNMIKEHYSDFGNYNFPIEMRNLIEKIAVWYELRYPSYEVNRLMDCCDQEMIDINEIMFKNNSYINDLLDEENVVKELDWDEFYNANVFIKSLPWEERRFFSKPRYNSIVYLDSNNIKAHLHLTKNGIVELAKNISIFTNGIIEEKELEGLHLNKVLELFKERGIKLPVNNDLEEEIKYINNFNYQKEEMLNCAMYRIIERGGNRIGPRRAFLFAKEFRRNIDIPMMYAVDHSDPGLRLFINEYIKAGGSKDLECYEGYFWKTSNKEKFDTISIQELIIKQNNNATFYTPEEDKLHQKFVNILASQVDHDFIKKEEVKKLRLERKLEKSRKNYKNQK